MNSRQQKPKTTRVGRFVRGRRFDRNPLRRATDLAETLLLALLAVAFLAGTPAAALGSGAWAHAVAQRTEAAQAASRYQVTAVTLTTPGQPRGLGNLAPEARARWTAPDGTVVTNDLSVPIGTKPGTAVPVWTTRDGQLTEQPMGQSGVTAVTVLGGVFGALGFAGLLAVVGVLARRSIDKRAMAAWDAEWRATGPRWTTRR